MIVCALCFRFTFSPSYEDRMQTVTAAFMSAVCIYIAFESWYHKLYGQIILFIVVVIITQSRLVALKRHSQLIAFATYCFCYFFDALQNDHPFLDIGFLLVFLPIFALANDQWIELLARNFYKDLRLVEQISKAQSFTARLLPLRVLSNLKETRGISGIGTDIVCDTSNETSVLFCDIDDFARLAWVLKPAHLVGLLNVVFSTFDLLVEKYGCMRVGTVHDAYIACTSAEERRRVGQDGELHRVVALVDCAMAMLRASKHFTTRTAGDVRLRLGIHIGPVIGGVVGALRPRYHVLGSTVTIVSREEVFVFSLVAQFCTLFVLTCATIPPPTTTTTTTHLTHQLLTHACNRTTATTTT
jgi:hypothetical protein